MASQSGYKIYSPQITTPQPDSKYALIRKHWGTRSNFQACYGLKMTPEDLEEGEAILETFLKADREEQKEVKEAETKDSTSEAPSAWHEANRSRYLAGGRSILKEQAAAQAAEEYEFTPTGDPEMDMMIAIGLEDLYRRGEMERPGGPLPGEASGEEWPEGAAKEEPMVKTTGRLKGKARTDGKKKNKKR